MKMSSHKHALMLQGGASRATLSRAALARRVFLTTYAAMLLTSALFASPLLAAHPDFAHDHPDNVPDHVHNLTTVMGHGAVTAVIDSADVVQPLGDWLVLPQYSQPSQNTPQTVHCRSPPSL